MNTLDERIEATEKELAKLKAEREATRNLTEAQQLAIWLHNCTCRYNHTDQCSWYYNVKDGVHDWDAHQQSTYHKKAQALLAEYDKETIMNVVGIFTSPLL